MEWNAILEEIRSERRQKLGEPPTLEDFIALREGALSEEQRRRVLEHASYDSEVARELLAVLRFPDALDGEDDAEEDQAWAEENLPAMRDTLRREGIWPRAETEAAVTTARESRPAVSDRRWLPLAAMFLFGVLATWVATQTPWRPVSPSAGVRVNLPIIELLPSTVTDSSVRGDAEVVALPAEASGLVLTLLAPGVDSSTDDDFSVLIRHADGRTQELSGLNPGRGGIFALGVPREDLSAGEMSLQLRGADGSEVARYQFEVRWRP